MFQSLVTKIAGMPNQKWGESDEGKTMNVKVDSQIDLPSPWQRRRNGGDNEYITAFTERFSCYPIAYHPNQFMLFHHIAKCKNISSCLNLQKTKGGELWLMWMNGGCKDRSHCNNLEKIFKKWATYHLYLFERWQKNLCHIIHTQLLPNGPRWWSFLRKM